MPTPGDAVTSRRSYESGRGLGQFSPALEAPNGALRSSTAFECRNPTAHVSASQQTHGQDLLRADPTANRSGHTTQLKATIRPSDG
jgi:hypothetical protein